MLVNINYPTLKKSTMRRKETLGQSINVKTNCDWMGDYHVYMNLKF